MYYIEYTSNSGKQVPSKHRLFESIDSAKQHGQMAVASGMYRRYAVVNEGYKIMPPMDPKYVERKGLEGPFTTLSGKVVYYDPKEGKYYDPDTDMYMSYDEYQAYDNDRSGMKDERDEVKESVGALRQIVADKNAAKVHGILVDLFTASAIMQVYDAVNDANKEKMDTMLNTKAGLMKMADFAMTKVNEAEGDWSKDSGWQDYKGQKKDPYGNTIKDKNLAKRMAKAAKKQSAETDIDENQMQTAQEAMVDGEITKDSVKKSALELLVDIAKTSKQYKGKITNDQVHYLGSLVHDFDMAGIETEKYSEIEKLFRTASKTNKADMSMIQPAYAQAKTLDENQAYRDARLTTIQTNRTNRLNQIQQNRDDRKAELKTSRDARSIKNRAALDSLKETLSPEEKRLVSQMYNKDGTLTALGKKVMDHGKTKTNEAYSPGDENEEGMVSNCCGAPIMDVYQGHGRCSDCKEMASAEKVEESVNEGVADEAVHMERDHEVQMARSDLYKIANYAVKLHKMLKNVSEEQGIQGWMQAKITKSADYMSSVAHTLEYDMMEKHQSEPMAEAMDASKYHCEDCGCQMHNCKPECNCSHDSHDETGSWWKDADGNGVPDAFESAEKVAEAKAKPQQNLMAKTKALSKITKALTKKK